MTAATRLVHCVTLQRVWRVPRWMSGRRLASERAQSAACDYPNWGVASKVAVTSGAQPGVATLSECGPTSITTVFDDSIGKVGKLIPVAHIFGLDWIKLRPVEERRRRAEPVQDEAECAAARGRRQPDADQSNEKCEFYKHTGTHLGSHSAAVGVVRRLQQHVERLDIVRGAGAAVDARAVRRVRDEKARRVIHRQAPELRNARFAAAELQHVRLVRVERRGDVEERVHGPVRAQLEGTAMYARAAYAVPKSPEVASASVLQAPPSAVQSRDTGISATAVCAVAKALLRSTAAGGVYRCALMCTPAAASVTRTVPASEGPRGR
ncbi:hypothetical protein GGX14DRAFT_397662 [Mycena pura]|uniref:Uncharacterized protein n=1 Tax=Mycena pura TaxID=153505 RepID=A0AAD6V7Y6_9AGAR|nr:hypothetical protein GGX14DRAFT_397662 [Mycena pura]